MGIKFIKLSVVYLVIGVLWGMVMSITHDFTSMSGHTHLLCLGWEISGISGVIYCLFPRAGQTTLAKIQFWTAVVGAPLMSVGVTFLAYKQDQFEPLAAVGGIILTVGIILMAINVFLNVKKSNT